MPSKLENTGDGSTAAQRMLTKRMDSDAAVLFFGPGDEAFAHRVAECLEIAVAGVGRLLAYPESPAQVFIYRNRDEMVRGLRRTLNYRDWQVDAILRTGISARTRNTLHIHRRLAGWGDYLLHAIVDEHSQGVMEELFGPGPAREATWLEEGLSTNLARSALIGRQPELEERLYHRSLRICAHDLVLGRLPRLARIADHETWFRNIARGGRPWSAQYAYADCAVADLIEAHGLGPLLTCLEAIGGGEPWESALKSLTGRSPGALERRIRRRLLGLALRRVYWRRAQSALAPEK